MNFSLYRLKDLYETSLQEIILYCNLAARYLPSCFAGQTAITIDDAPYPESAYYNGNERTKIIAEKLSKSKVRQAMFFATGKYINNNNGIEHLEKYANNGHLIANHSYDHLDFNRVVNKAYSDDILKNQELIKNLSTFSRFFRYPFLHEGNAIKKEITFVTS